MGEIVVDFKGGMAAKLKQIKTQNEYNMLTSAETIGNKVGVVVFYSGKDAAAWKAQLRDLNDLAGDFFDEASFIGVDARFFPAILQTFPGAAEGKAAVFKADQTDVVDSSVDSIKGAINKVR